MFVPGSDSNNLTIMDETAETTPRNKMYLKQTGCGLCLRGSKFDAMAHLRVEAMNPLRLTASILIGMARGEARRGEDGPHCSDALHLRPAALNTSQFRGAPPRNPVFIYLANPEK